MLKPDELIIVFDDIILGRGVKRAIHNLVYEGNNYVNLFVQRLRMYQFHPIALGKIEVDIGYRIPAFYIRNHTALFGYIFWEVFSDKKKRKLWGSVIRNEKGDWKYILPGQSNHTVFANLKRREPVDIYYLS